jgi:hypothetical protein
MGQIINITSLPAVVQPILLDETESSVSTSKPFIEANTTECSLRDIKNTHVIPVWMRDNEPLISHADFIQATNDAVQHVFRGERIFQPSIRLSHPVKGRVPSAKDKPAHMLLDEERTLWYERMMFVIELPSIQAEVDGNLLSLTVGGMKTYAADNLYQKSGGDQHFKLFAGFRTRVCSNLNIWSDGYAGSITVKNMGQLTVMIKSLLESYDSSKHLRHLSKLADYSITENQFAQLIGKCRMYQHLPTNLKQNIPALIFGDMQLGAVCRDYYKDKSFCRDVNGNISLWRFLNLFTGANKSTYIDQFLDRSVNAYNFVDQVRARLDGDNSTWYLN